MRQLALLAYLGWASVTFVRADVAINKTADGWDLANGSIQVSLQQTASGIQLRSIHCNGGNEWAAAGTPLVKFPNASPESYTYNGQDISTAAPGGKKLTLHFRANSGARVSLSLELHDQGAVLRFGMLMENKGTHDIPLGVEVDPLLVVLKQPQGGLVPYSPVVGHHGFQQSGDLAQPRRFPDWLVLENRAAGESILIGGEPGLGILSWRASVDSSGAGATVKAGTILRKETNTEHSGLFVLGPGETVEAPMAFLAIAKGDSDNAGNETFRYLKRYVFQTPVADSPLVTYCIWLTQKNSEEPILKELEVAKRVGFDVFYHDATWYQGASVVPGMNDFTLELGSYQESREKFPHGIASVSTAVRAAGLKFGIWVDPGNVDSARVKSGEIPAEWLAKIDGKRLETKHPSLAITDQLCLGDPKVVKWIEEQLGDIIEKWHLDWIKWDPSATVSYECNRTDHGHNATNGAYAAYRGRLEIVRYLLNRFPNLSGFECDPSLEYARVTAGPRDLLPGGYTNEFITGPMVSPNVWGSLATAGKGEAAANLLTARWYSASALDYYFRKHLVHGVTFGNINGMYSQFLSAAPPGFVEAFQRNLMYFKQYRHLLLEDVYHPKLGAEGWSAIQYAKSDASESVVYVFRDKSPAAETTVQLRGLDPHARYRVTSLNARPGRETIVDGEHLMKGISVKLPEQWLAAGDGMYSDEFADQMQYGSDVLLLARQP
jgi:alpha-galactosidase